MGIGDALHDGITQTLIDIRRYDYHVDFKQDILKFLEAYVVLQRKLDGPCSSNLGGKNECCPLTEKIIKKAALMRYLDIADEDLEVLLTE